MLKFFLAKSITLNETEITEVKKGRDTFLTKVMKNSVDNDFVKNCSRVRMPWKSQ